MRRWASQPSGLLSLASLLVVLLGIAYQQYYHGGGSLLGQVAADPEMTCSSEDDESCQATPQQGSFQVLIVNDSNYRADVYWDDGRFGKFLVTLEKKGGTGTLNTSRGHEFFVTRHGVREGLFDLTKDTPIRFKTAGTEKMVIPDHAAPSPNKCQDRYGICPHEAAKGSCKTAPGWMIVHCCKSCDAYLDASTLIDPKKRCSKQHLNMTDNIWKPGDLNKLFEEWATSADYKQYDPHVWSSPDGNSYGLGENVQTGPWVMTFDNFFTEEEAQALIQGGRMVGFDRSTDQGQVNAAGEMEKVVSQTRTSSNAWCIGACERLPQVQAVTARIESVTKVPKSHYESFQILEYSKNQFYRSHHDSSSNKDDSPSGHRIFTFFLYLSDVEEGGETYFNRLDLAVKPKLGRALVWPSVLNEDPETWDPRMFHEARDVIKGTKYAANHWYVAMFEKRGASCFDCRSYTFSFATGSISMTTKRPIFGDVREALVSRSDKKKKDAREKSQDNNIINLEGTMKSTASWMRLAKRSAQPEK